MKVLSSLNEILKRIAARKKLLKGSLDSLVIQLSDIGAIKIVLFGSFARDEVDINSDIDLFVIMPPNRSGREWPNLIYEKIERKTSSDIIVFNLNEYQKELSSNLFLSNIEKTGIILYEKT